MFKRTEGKKKTKITNKKTPRTVMQLSKIKGLFLKKIKVRRTNVQILGIRGLKCKK
jgi:hypothetical protein